MVFWPGTSSDRNESIPVDVTVADWGTSGHILQFRPEPSLFVLFIALKIFTSLHHTCRNHTNHLPGFYTINSYVPPLWIYDESLIQPYLHYMTSDYKTSFWPILLLATPNTNQSSRLILWNVLDRRRSDWTAQAPCVHTVVLLCFLSRNIRWTTPGLS